MDTEILEKIEALYSRVHDISNPLVNEAMRSQKTGKKQERQPDSFSGGW